MVSTLGKRSRDSSSANPTTPTKRRVLQLLTPEKTPRPSHKRGLSTASSVSSNSSSTPYSPAKSVLRRSATAGIVGRVKELECIREFIASEEALLYVCGPPGTGKSATISQFMTNFHKTMSPSDVESIKVVSVNCVSLPKPEAVYAQILLDLGQQGSTLMHIRDHLEVLDSRGEEVLLVLDEVDYLTSNNSKVMYSLFELGTSDNIKIIGIANALNLTDSVLPHLRKSGIEPSVLRFKPYTPSEITQILSSRVSEIDLPSGASKIVDKNALDFLGRKVANATGDIRKALDILRKSIEVVESEYRSALSSLPVNTSEPKLNSVGIKHISKVAAQALGGVTGSSVIQTLSIHEKAILCTIVVRKTTTISATFDAYVALCKRDKMLSSLSRSEFGTVVSGMLDNSVLNHPTRAKQGLTRTPSKRGREVNEERIVLGVSEMDVLKGIGEIGILKRFFDK